MASEGAYGAPSYDRTAHHAKALTRAVELYMPDASSFTRDDLLHLPTFSSVATITAYRYVLEAVTYAIERGWMIPVSRTELVLSGRKRAYTNAATAVETYRASIVRLLPNHRFAVAAIVDAWTTDTHLTHSAKRTMVRQILHSLVKDGVVNKIDFDEYERA